MRIDFAASHLRADKKTDGLGAEEGSIMVMNFGATDEDGELKGLQCLVTAKFS